jgi:hypothetical protein
MRFRNIPTTVQGANATAGYRSSSVNPNLSQYYFKIGQSVIPNKPVYLINGSGTGTLTGTYSEAYAELQKAFHTLGTAHGASSMAYNQYNVAVTANGNIPAGYAINTLRSQGVLDTSNNNFMIGQELESFAHKSNVILSGISTLNTNLFFTGTINSGATTGASNITADVIGMHDLILIIENGLISSRS